MPGGPSGASLGNDILGYLYPEVLAGGSTRVTFEQAMSVLPAGQEVRADLVAERLKDLEPSPTLIQLAESIREGVLAPLVITPNFDDLAEKALRAVGVKQIRVIIGDDVTERNQLIAPPAVTVLKVHGDTTRPLSMRLDPATLDRLPGPLEAALGTTVEKHGLLIIGYALRDPGLHRALSWARTNAVVAWIDIGPPTSQVDEILAFHGATENSLGEGVASFVNILQDRSFSHSIYNTAEQRIGSAWERLDRARSRDRDIKELERLCSIFDGEDAGLLAEVQALRQLAIFDHSEQSDARAFREGVRVLKDTFAKRGALPPAARARVAARFMQELTRAHFYGVDEDFLASTGASHDEVDRTVTAVRNEVDDYTRRAGVSPCDRAACLIHVAEALKELQQRLPTGDASRLEIARECAEAALNLLEPMATALGTSRRWSRCTQLQGIAERHLGVIHEYLASLPTASGSERLEHIREMGAHSRRAADYLTAIGEQAVCGYAEMNWCLAETRIVARESYPWPDLVTQYERLKAGYLLAESYFRKVRDRRGLAWVNAHLAGLCAHFITAMGDRVIHVEIAYALSVVDDMHRYATMGRAWSQRVMGDSMAFGLSSIQAAAALVAFTHRGVVREGEPDSQLRRAIHLADEGIAHLAGTRRTHNAAMGSMTKAEALLLLGNYSSPTAAVGHRAEAVSALADAIAMLVRSGTMNTVEFQSEYDGLIDVLERIRGRYLITV